MPNLPKENISLHDQSALLLTFVGRSIESVKPQQAPPTVP